MSNLPDLSGKTILQVIPALSAGGAERGVLDVADAITSAGGKALVACTGGRLTKELKALGGELIEMDVASKNPVTLFGNIKRFASLIGERQIDLVHARSRAPAWSAWFAAQKTQTPFVTTYHGAYSGQSRLKKIYNSIMTRGDLVIANSSWIGDHIHRTHELSDDKIIVIPRGVDFDKFDPEKVTSERVEDLRRAWGIGTDNNRLVLLLPARLTSWKGQRLTLQALAMLGPDELEKLVLVMAGDAQGRGSFLTALETDIATHNLVEAVRIVGHCEDMPAAFKAADIVLAPSLRPEAFGRVAAEAAAMGKPVIASDHGGARETVIDGVTGARFEPGNVSALAGALRSLVSVGAETRDTMGQSGRAHTLQHFSKRGLQAATLSVYSALIAQGKLRAS